MVSFPDGYFGRLTVGDKTIEIWGSTEYELEKLTKYYKENHSEFEATKNFKCRKMIY